jgi:hypothetical protein
VRCDGHPPRLAGKDLEAREPCAQLTRACFLGDGHHGRAEVPDLPGQHLEVASSSERDDGEALGKASHHVEGGATDRTRRAENRELLQLVAPNRRKNASTNGAA